MVKLSDLFKRKNREAEEVTEAPEEEKSSSGDSDDSELQELLDAMASGENQWEDDEATLSLGYAHDYAVELVEGAHVAIGKVHGIGGREMQQDAFSNTQVMQDEAGRRVILVVVADGMGGMSSGEKASMETVVSCLTYFDEHTEIPENPCEYMRDMAECANKRVKAALGGDGRCGSTLITALVREQSLYFNSVGDSHIVLYRNGTLTQLNTDHNYGTLLQRQVAQGLISPEEAANAKQKNALTSYIGQEYLQEIDANETPIDLLPGDRILLMSDGIYNTLSEQDIIETMNYPLYRSAMYIEMGITKTNKRNQDNYTCLMIEVK